MKIVKFAVPLACIALAAPLLIGAQSAGFKRIPIQRGDLSVPGREVVQAIAELPAGVVHDAKVAGDKPSRMLATYIVEKGKPLATPAP